MIQRTGDPVRLGVISFEKELKVHEENLSKVLGRDFFIISKTKAGGNLLIDLEQ